LHLIWNLQSSLASSCLLPLSIWRQKHRRLHAKCMPYSSALLEAPTGHNFTTQCFFQLPRKTSPRDKAETAESVRSVLLVKARKLFGLASTLTSVLFNRLGPSVLNLGSHGNAPRNAMVPSIVYLLLLQGDVFIHQSASTEGQGCDLHRRDSLSTCEQAPYSKSRRKTLFLIWLRGWG
jgi:hypothetical protein